MSASDKPDTQNIHSIPELHIRGSTRSTSPRICLLTLRSTIGTYASVLMSPYLCAEALWKVG